jgi:excisionase family DNA binding protein
MDDDALEINTYSLSDVAKMVLPPEMTDGVRWLSRRLNRGELSGYRVGRTWRMTREDVEDLIERHRKHPLPRVAQEQRTDVVSGLTPTSRLRLMRSDS